MVLSTLILSAAVFSVSKNSVYSQNTTEDKKSEENIVFLDWTEIAKIVGLSTILSGSLSAFLTHFLSIKKLKEEHSLSIKKLKEEIRITKLENKTRIYSEIKSIITRMIKNPEYRNEVEPIEKLKKTIDEIDKILIPNSYLIDTNIQDKWWEVRYSLREATRHSSVENWGECKNNVQQMHDLLQNEFNSMT